MDYKGAQGKFEGNGIAYSDGFIGVYIFVRTHQIMPFQ